MDDGGPACPVFDVRVPADAFIDVEVLVVGAANVDDSANEFAPPASADVRADELKGVHWDSAPKYARLPRPAIGVLCHRISGHAS